MKGYTSCLINFATNFGDAALTDIKNLKLAEYERKYIK